MLGVVIVTNGEFFSDPNTDTVFPANGSVLSGVSGCYSIRVSMYRIVPIKIGSKININVKIDPTRYASVR